MGHHLMVVDYKRNNATIAQQVEHVICNDEVPGSIPGGGSTTVRVSYSGNTSAFQADAGSSILPTRSKLL